METPGIEEHPLGFFLLLCVLHLLLLFLGSSLGKLVSLGKASSTVISQDRTAELVGRDYFMPGAVFHMDNLIIRIWLAGDFFLF
jgi:hypothetical protein